MHRDVLIASLESKRVGAQRFTGSETGRSLGGFWVQLEGRGQMMGEVEHTTILSLGYDPLAGRYRGTFIGSMMSHLWIYDGAVDPATGILTLDTEGPSFTDQSVMASYRDTIEFKTDDHRVLTSSYQDASGTFHQFMKTDYHRVRA